MSRRSLLGVVLLSLLTTANSSFAGRINHRQHHQNARIKEGVRSGELTRGETRRLRKEQKHVGQLERKAKADGQVTAQERRRIERAQDRTNKDIYRAKHNPHERGPANKSAPQDNSH